jgi:hypothetical protein
VCCTTPSETMKTEVYIVSTAQTEVCTVCTVCLPVLVPQVDLTSGVRLGPGVVRYKGQEPYRGIADGTTTSENLSQVRH